jgi:FkbM family methyltransferase
MHLFERILLSVLRRGVLPVLPRRQRLPFRYWLHARGGSCECELRYLDSYLAQGKVALDIGANEGLYAYRLSQLFLKVYAFEVNDTLTGDLAAYNPGNITIIHQGLSSRAGSATLYVPVVNGRALTGWASLAPGNCPDTREHLEKPVTVCTLDSLDLKEVGFIKIDVEGHEAEVFKGAQQTLARNLPVVLAEIKEQNRAEVFSLFERLQYQRRQLQDLINVPGSAENYIFLPPRQAGLMGPAGTSAPLVHVHTE